jgi:hypothetical protein
MTYCKVRPEDCKSWCMVPLKEVADVLEDSDPSETWVVEVVHITEEEFEALPEFEGW